MVSLGSPRDLDFWDGEARTHHPGTLTRLGVPESAEQMDSLLDGWLSLFAPLPTALIIGAASVTMGHPFHPSNLAYGEQ